MFCGGISKLVSWGSQDHRCKRNAGKDHLWSPLSSQTAMMVTQAVKLASTLPLGSAAVPHLLTSSWNPTHR